MIWGLVCKPSKQSFSIADKIYPMLGDAMLEKKVAAHLSQPGHSIKEIGKKTDKIVVIGGDGTILMTMKYTTKPVFTINTGAVGFLAEVEANDAVKGMKKVLDGKCFVEERIRIKTLLNGERLPDATNEVTVHVSNIGKILSISLFVNGTVTEEINGDGIIIATPTGSTSYVLSVGGPIVDPSLKTFIAAPISPFRHISAPLVIPADKKLNVKVTGEKKARVVIDGIRAGTLSKKDEMVLSLSDKQSSFIRLEDNFYDKIYKKISFRVKRPENGKNMGN
ncbi:MAG: NAD(+)/NADH kinase [Candidatus Thermoplasmatota archaeon]|nr:NAD(+)/NADH kinase [Candidatus Thermoplasmatota archaeon]